ncbi:TIGR00282 family metallophosphoesterase [Alkalihalobacterium chitinilyticum]|uniref:TIGR00282 family metallophosphoesterase n=1 Tax=Alkalihalobacterium chitinilyticum TaxID=2980103 RepID=A0ABT5VEK4_9BACI|nr:TIGR00282 family metallophosphoesterase [Alkalihalobacterium chitinilyticum]MDE5412888.1 TIGR00282 family metallophosphoesterase [Alkalihalobacterium chitinilyticum]
MKILFVGDVVGSPGRAMVKEYLPKLKKKYRPQISIINGENAAGGKGITQKIYKGFLDAGAQAVTLGNHSWDNREIFEFIDDAKTLVRPANYPDGTPGQGYTIVKINSIEVVVINLMGRTFLPPNDCPFRKVDEILEQVKARTPYIFVDFHAEATSEKQAMGWYLDGKVTAVVGTHTHVQTADQRVLPKGTAYITDVGMTGPYDGILGMERSAVLNKFLTNLPVRFEVADGRDQLNGVVITVDEKSGRAKSIDRVLINEDSPFFE